MTEKSSLPAVFTQVPKVIGEVEAVSKSHDNVGQGYKFRSIDDVYNAINKALAKHGVSISAKYSVIENEVKESVKKTQWGDKVSLTRQVVILGEYKVYANDGSFIEASSIGEANDTSDKAFNKAMSAAYKYFMFQTFVIPTEESKDTEATSPELISKKKTQDEAPLERIFNVEKFIANIAKAEDVARLNLLKDAFKTATDADGKMGLTTPDIANIMAELAKKLKSFQKNEPITADEVKDLFEAN